MDTLIVPHAPFTLSPDQHAITDMARGFADEQLAPHALRWDAERHFPTDVIRSTATLGMAGIYVSEQHGGSGLGRLDAALIFEALSTGCPAVAAYISIHNMVAWMVDRFGDAAQRALWVPRLCRMDLLGAYCLTEPASGSDAAALTTRARRDGEDYVLDGVKQFISGAGAADIYLVLARTGGGGAAGVSAFIVERGAPGLSFGANEHKMGWNAQPTRQVILEGVRVPATQRLGEESTGFRMAMAGLDGGRLNIAACSLGGAQSAMEKAVAYMRDRRAFGQPLTEFQGLQFRLADMSIELEAARSYLWRAAAALDARLPSAPMLCAGAKRFVTDAGFNVANQALQLHGGYGYLADYGVEKIVRDLRVHQILEGTNEIMRVIVARGPAQGLTMADVDIRAEGHAGRITLNRPQALNALNLPMVEAIEAALARWAADPAISLVILDGAGGRALCSGGDIRAIYAAARDGDPGPPHAFFSAEYRMNATIARYAKPYVALMDNLVMGGGVGISAHGSVRVVTERTMLSMPETAIGLFPDVGATWLLSRNLPLGLHLALTGARIGAGDAIAAGLADTCVASERLPGLVTALCLCTDMASVRACVSDHAMKPPPATIVGDWLATCYGQQTMEAIHASLAAHADPAALHAASEIAARSPSSLKVSLRALREAAHMDSLETALRQELVLAMGCMRSHDFVEGVRAALIDKDRKPVWQPATLPEVSDAAVDSYFH